MDAKKDFVQRNITIIETASRPDGGGDELFRYLQRRKTT